MRKRSVIGLTALGAAAGIGAFILAVAAAPEPQGYRGTYVWSIPDARFGGLSAIEVAPDGMGFLALSDHGTFVAARITRDDTGHITGVTDAVLTSQVDTDGRTLGRSRDDSESLAVAADGTIFVGQEGPARVLRHAAPQAPATELPRHPDFARMQKNSALEALAIADDGTLYTLPERSGAQDHPFPVYRFANGTWDQPFGIPRDGGYLPVAADIGPDGRLYVLERDFRWLLGFASRLRRFDLAGDMIRAGETLIETPSGAHQNLEGLSVWRDSEGKLRATMVSDDNFRFFLGTTLVEYTLAD